jgi:glycosyltransferase involved in cell wall biosynthesis
MKLTITITGRNDNHSGDFLERLRRSVEENVYLMNKYFKYEYEYLIIDWGSQLNNCLFRMDDLCSIIKKEEVRMIVVPCEVIKNRFCEERFYQFFAKNVGIIHAKGEYVLMINADNILNKNLIFAINTIINSDIENSFYRTKYWREDDIVIDCDKNVSESEKGLAPIYSGDFLLCKKKTLIEKGKGYDETNLKHQTEKAQSGMDGEILFNLRYNGVTPMILDEEIYHIPHERRTEYDFVYNRNGYQNSNNWGFSDKNLKLIKDNIWTI